MKKFLIRVGLFIISIWLMNYAIVWWYEIPQRKEIAEGTYKRLRKWNDIHASENQYDVIIMGSSRAYCSYNPAVIDSITNTNTYNMGTGAQNVIESYYYLKELLRFQKPNYVVFETFLPSFISQPDHFNVLTNAKFMSEKGKNDMILGDFKGQATLNFFFPIMKYKYRFRKQLMVSAGVEGNEIQDNPTWIKGYLYSSKVVDSSQVKNFGKVETFENVNVSTEYAKKYIGLLRELCEEYGVKLIGVRAPYPPSRMAQMASDSTNEYFTVLYASYDIPFYDFNYDSNTQYSDFDFTDSHHMNYYGANKVSADLANILLDKQRIPTGK